MMKTIIRNAHVHPITSPSTPHCDVLIEDEYISAVGRNIQGITDMEWDAHNLDLYPGFIDAHTHLGLINEGLGELGRDSNETSSLMTPHLRAIDSVYLFDIGFQDAIAAGITTVQVLPGSSNIIGGVGSVIHTFGGNLEEMIIREQSGLKIALGENPKRNHSPLTRMGIMGELRDLFTKVTFCEYVEGSLKIEPIISVLQKQMPVRIHAHRADDIMAAIRFAKEFNLDLRIEHCTEGFLVTDSLLKSGAMVTVGPNLTGRTKVETRSKQWENYGLLDQAGIPVSITTDHPVTPIQYLPICAGLAYRSGLPREKAIAGITITPAQNLGVDHLIGSIQVGKLADLVLWDGDPLLLSSQPLWTMMNGKIVYSK